LICFCGVCAPPPNQSLQRTATAAAKLKHSSASNSRNEMDAPKTDRLRMVENSMQLHDVMHETLVFEREIPAPVVDVFSAYADARARAAWSAPSSDTIIYDCEEFLEGRHDHYRCGPKTSPNIHGTTHYLEILQNKRIVSSETLAMDGMKLAVSLITTEFGDLGTATRLKCTVQIASFVGQDMVRGYEDGNKGALNRLVRHFAQGEA
jgi:uncharacterized protein YndB with AHSA1/START domain